ncbi:MAG: hypothetical protein ACRDN0_38910, partial [Trebonia sp.]
MALNCQAVSLAPGAEQRLPRFFPLSASGLTWPCGIAALGLAATAVLDMIGDEAFGAGEAQHLVTAGGAALLFRQARAAAARTRGPAPA